MRDANGSFRQMSQDEIAREFVERAVPVPESGCWLWSGNTTRHGYGVLAGKYMHRYAYRVAHGAIPEGAHVLHKCDVPCCVNPDHIFLGSQADNNADKVAKGRAKGGSMKGDAHPMHKLTAEEVAEIRSEYASMEHKNQSALARKYGVSQGQIWSILNNRNWRHA
jgi:hypothetical protein